MDETSRGGMPKNPEDKPQERSNTNELPLFKGGTKAELLRNFCGTKRIQITVEEVSSCHLPVLQVIF